MFKNTAVSKKKKHLTHIRSSICNSHLVTSKWNSWSTVGTQKKTENVNLDTTKLSICSIKLPEKTNKKQIMNMTSEGRLGSS